MNGCRCVRSTREILFFIFILYRGSRTKIYTRYARVHTQRDGRTWATCVRTRSRAGPYARAPRCVRCARIRVYFYCCGLCRFFTQGDIQAYKIIPVVMVFCIGVRARRHLYVAFSPSPQKSISRNDFLLNPTRLYPSNGTCVYKRRFFDAILHDRLPTIKINIEYKIIHSINIFKFVRFFVLTQIRVVVSYNCANYTFAFPAVFFIFGRKLFLAGKLHLFAGCNVFFANIIPLKYLQGDDV